jgi:hypothetical protein
MNHSFIYKFVKLNFPVHDPNDYGYAFFKCWLRSVWGKVGGFVYAKVHLFKIQIVSI